MTGLGAGPTAEKYTRWCSRGLFHSVIAATITAVWKSLVKEVQSLNSWECSYIILLFLCLFTGGIFSSGCFLGSGFSVSDRFSGSWNVTNRWCNEITPFSRKNAKTIACSLDVRNAQVLSHFSLFSVVYTIIIGITMRNLIWEILCIHTDY